MQYVGMDVHWRQTAICILDENGRRVKMMNVRGAWPKVLEELGRLEGPWEVCFEASCGYGWLYERLKKMAQKVVVAHPGQLRLIFRSKRKSDRVDAEKLAKLLYLDEVPPVYVPSVQVRSWRAMIEHRQKLLQERVRTKNQLRALLRTHAIVAPRGLWTQKGLAWIEAQDLPTSMDRLQRDILLERIGSLRGLMRRVEEALGEIAQSQAGVNLLMEIPGVGIRTAEAVMAYVDDPHRFRSVKSIGSYFGLVPCQDQSAGKNQLGHLTRQGPATVRKLLTEASWQAIRRSKKIRAHFERIRQGNPERKRIALVATAHYLLRVMLAMLRTGEVWRAEAA
ncbi:MAG: IS110 family transposase [Candidatus Brocadiia bacterium]